MSEPERLLASGSTLARQILESGTVERPSSVSLERTMASLSKEHGLCSRIRGRRSETRRVVQSSVKLRRLVIARSRTRQWPLLALLAALSLLLSAAVSYHWRPAAAPAHTSGPVPAPAGWQHSVR